MPGTFNMTPRAKEDLRRIWNYTADTWNEDQADKYVGKIYNRFAWLANRPQVGRHRSDICDGYYCFSEGRHLIFYLIRDERIDIIGIPHKEMDILNYFDADD